MSCLKAFDAMCKRIVSPTRHHQLDEKDMMERKFRRRPPNFQLLNIQNDQRQMLSCIVFPVNFELLPSVLYLHGNGGHKMEALQLVNGNINLIAFDFAACGKSEGKYVTYGDKEVRDIACVIQEIRKRYPLKRLTLWGRSMGASIAIMYASMHPKDISTLILDTPFRGLGQVVKNVAEHNNKSIPSLIINLVLYFVEGKIQEMVGINIFENDFLMHLNLLDLPIMFLYSTQDAVVLEANVRELHNSYKGRKELIKMDCLHHQDRPREAIQEGLTFLASEEGYRSTRSSMTSCSRRGISMSLRGSPSQTHF